MTLFGRKLKTFSLYIGLSRQNQIIFGYISSIVLLYKYWKNKMFAIHVQHVQRFFRNFGFTSSAFAQRWGGNNEFDSQPK